MHFLLSTLSHIAIALTVHYLSIFFNLFLFNWLLLFNLFLFNWLLFLFNWLLFFNRLLFYYRLLLLGWIFLSWFISLFSAFSDLAFGLLAYELSLIIFLLTRWLRRKHIFFFLLGMLWLAQANSFLHYSFQSASQYLLIREAALPQLAPIHFLITPAILVILANRMSPPN